MQNKVTLKVNGKKYENWLDVSITCTLQSLARVFAVKSTRSKEDLTIGIEPQDEVQVLIDDEPVLTGYVTKREVSYSSSGVTITITGASKTVDLQDCCMPTGKPNSFRNQTHFQNLSAVCEPFGIKVVDEVKSVDRRNLEFSPTEKVGSAIINYLQKNGVLLTDNEFGNLVIAEAGSAGNAHDTLELGKNILEGKRTQDYSKRFSHYVTLGQVANPTSELPVSANHLREMVEDKSVRRTRYIVKQESGNASSEILKKKAGVLRDVGLGESDVLTYKVQGWKQSNGELWRVNLIVRFADRMLGKFENASWVITQISYSMSSSGTTAALTLKMKSLFNLCAVPDAKKITIESDTDIKKDSGRI